MGGSQPSNIFRITIASLGGAHFNEIKVGGGWCGGGKPLNSLIEIPPSAWFFSVYIPQSFH